MPIDASPDVPLLSRLDTALLRRTAAALVARSGEYGDLFVEEVRQAEILRDGLEPGAVVTGAIGAIPHVARESGGRDPVPAVRLRAELRVQRVAIASSEGDVVEDRRAWARFTVRIAVPGRGGRLLEAATGGGARDPGRLEALRPPLSIAEELRRALDEAEHAAPAPTGLLPVVLGPGVGGILFHEACGHGLEGDRAMRGRSAFADLLGEAVGPETLTLVDDPTLDGLSGSRRVDDEGWPSAPLVLIDAGRV